MAQEQYGNLAESTLVGSIGAGETTITVSSATSFPTGVPYRIVIVPSGQSVPTTGEILSVTSVTGAVWTVTRGAENTPAQSHSNNDRVVHILTKDGLRRLGTHLVQTGVHASRPAASSANEGSIYIASDSPVFARSDGANWRTFGPIYQFKTPSGSVFTLINSGATAATGATLITTGDVIVFHGGGSTAGLSENLRLAVMGISSGTPWRVYAAITSDAVARTNLGFGLCWREDLSGRVVTFGQRLGTAVMRLGKYVSPTSFNADYNPPGSTSVAVAAWPLWLSIEDNGTNRNAYYSIDGRNWVLVHSIGRTDFLVADGVGFYVNAHAAAAPALDVNLTILSWEVVIG
jgi:hypothetical protein